MRKDTCDRTRSGRIPSPCILNMRHGRNSRGSVRVSVIRQWQEKVCVQHWKTIMCQQIGENFGMS